MQQESIYARIHKVLTWKRVLAFNILLLLVLVVPLSVRLAQQDTENRSSASENIAPPSPTPPPSYPSQPPSIDRVTFFYGKPGDVVVLLGENFGDFMWESSLYIGNAEVSQDEVVRWSDGVIEAQIPQGARSGQVWVTVNSQRANWDGVLFIYNPQSSSRVGLRSSNGPVELWIEQGGVRVTRGVVEVGYELGTPSVGASEGVNILSQEITQDSYGNILRVEFEAPSIPLVRTPIFTLSGSSSYEIVEAQFFNANGESVDVYSSPEDVALSLN